MMKYFPRDYRVLREPTTPVDQTFFGSDACMKTYFDMLHTMRELGGVGIAAPQIGISNSIFVVELGDLRLQGKIHGMVLNPQIRYLGDESTIFSEVEGCLSCAETVEVPRHYRINLVYNDWEGQGVSVVLDGYAARVVQHEMDHLAGKLIVDYKKENDAHLS